MTDQPSTADFLTPRLQRWLTALVILGTVAVAFVVVSDVTGLIAYFGDVIMVFFLAWLLAFILSPLASALVHLFPRLPRALAVILVYALLIGLLIAAILLVAQQLYSSINNLVTDWPTGPRLKSTLQPAQDWLNSVGGRQISLYDQVNLLLDNVKNGAGQLAKPLGDVAVASLGVFGNLLFVFFLSLYMAVDRDRIVRFLFRLVPPSYTEQANLLEHSVARSFGGFLRGQALSGVIYGAVSMAASMLLGLPYMPVTAASSGVLQAIPFFAPGAVLPVLIIMIAGWFVLMNVIQPRLMAEAVGLHPVVVLGSVMVGSKLAGIPGAIFGIPVAAVVAAFFFYYLGRNYDTGSVALRAARRVEEREGRPIRVPRLPHAGQDQEVESAAASDAQPHLDRHRMARAKPPAAPDAGAPPEAEAPPAK